MCECGLVRQLHLVLSHCEGPHHAVVFRKVSSQQKPPTPPLLDFLLMQYTTDCWDLTLSECLQAFPATAA